MFYSSGFEPPQRPTPPRTPFTQNRTVGALIVLLGMVAVLVFALSMDAAVFNPANTARDKTLTATAQKGEFRDFQPFPPDHPPLGGATPTPRPPRDFSHAM